MRTDTGRRRCPGITAGVFSFAVFAGMPPQSAAAAPISAFNVVGKSVLELADAQQHGRVTSLQLVDAYLERIRRFDRAGPALHSVLATNPQARAQARVLDRERAAGRVRGPLHGIPILIKDNIETADPLATTAGSLALIGNVSGRDAPLVARLRAAGAVILGKTNLSEWANIRSSVSISGWSAVGGQTRNPYARDRSACGSSSGSAAAVAASLAAAAVGTETDGSITCPASLTGLVGIKPTVGLVSRTHVVPISHSQDTPGPITHTVADATLLLRVMAGTDPLDEATREADAHKGDLAAPITKKELRGVRIGVLQVNGAPPSVRALFDATVKHLAEAGAMLINVETLADGEKLGDAELTVMLTELKIDLDAYLATTPAAVRARSIVDIIAFDRENAAAEMPYFGQDLFERALTTGGLQDPQYLKALETSRLAAGRDGLDKVLASLQLQAVIAPTMGPAFLIDPINGDALSWDGPGNVPAIAGYPHLTLPMGLVKGLPVGLSVIGPAWSDGTMLALGGAIERLVGQVAPPAL